MIDHQTEQVESFQASCTKIIDELKNLDLTGLRDILMDIHAVEKIQELLGSITMIVPIGSKKYYPTYQTWNDPNLRWIFINDSGENIASKIYEIIARDIADYIRILSDGAYSLVCYGSVAVGNSTFPISKRFPNIEHPEYLIPVNINSDIDFFITINKTPNQANRGVEDATYRRMKLLREYLPPPIKFDMPREFPISTISFIKESGLKYLEFTSEK